MAEVTAKKGLRGNEDGGEGNNIRTLKFMYKMFFFFFMILS